MATIGEFAARVDRRLRAEWPGVHNTTRRGRIEVPEVSKGGTTDALIQMAVGIAVEELVAYARENES